MVEPLQYKEFITLEISEVVLTDSGEFRKTTFKYSCLTLRPNTERPVTIAEGTNELVTYDNIEKTMTQCIRKLEAGRCQNWDVRQRSESLMY
jgi:UDP-N-acetylglucosamine 2-epimerase (non-hydrolysing)